VANGPLGQKGREASFFFFSQTLFKSNFSFQIQTKILQTFLQNFINFLEVTQATKTMQSQIMMHNHLLSLH
jgi:hypothetical protein